MVEFQVEVQAHLLEQEGFQEWLLNHKVQLLEIQKDTMESEFEKQFNDEQSTIILMWFDISK